MSERKQIDVKKLMKDVLGKRTVAWILTAATVSGLLPATTFTAGAVSVNEPESYTAVYELGVDTVDIQNNGVYKITGEGYNDTDRIKVPDNVTATVVLENVTMETSWSPIVVGKNAKLNLLLANGTFNTITSTATSDEVAQAAQAGEEVKTAGINVPDSAQITINAISGDGNDGELEVHAGYGGAGIGGSYTAEYSTTGKGNDGANGTDGGDGYVTDTQYLRAKGGVGGRGGTGGRDGLAGETAGTITIGSGTIKAYGGAGGAGIGGAMGTGGENGQDGSGGTAGATWKISDQFNVQGAGGIAGAGGGGEGGLGGAGGGGGKITISGGKVTAEGGTNAAGLGGGAGGTGGNGGNGGKTVEENTDMLKFTSAQINLPRQKGEDEMALYLNSVSTQKIPPTSTVNGTKSWTPVEEVGGSGAAGAGGSGGNGGVITITGGQVKAVGTVGAGGGVKGTAGIRIQQDAFKKNNHQNFRFFVANASNMPYKLEFNTFMGFQSETADAANIENARDGYFASVYASSGRTVWPYPSTYITNLWGNSDSNVSFNLETATMSQDLNEQGVAYLIPARYFSHGTSSRLCGDVNRDRGSSETKIALRGTYGEGGAGGTSGRLAGKNGADANVTIRSSTANVDFTDNATTPTTSANGRPLDKNGVQLYKKTIQVYKHGTTTAVPDATVKIKVNASNPSNAYTYNTVTDANGKAIVWLPQGTSTTLTGSDIYSEEYGGLSQNLSISATNMDTQSFTAYVGNQIVLSLANKNKVYISDSTPKPNTIQINASSISTNATSLQWFREKINKNDKTYNSSTFTAAYNTAKTANTQNADVINVGSTKSWELPIDENGHYWFMLQAGSYFYVADLVVSNIYRPYPIQVRSYDVNNKPNDNDGYAPLKTKTGEDYIAANGYYGFAWDLGGYTATGTLNRNNLLSEEYAKADTIMLYADDSKAPTSDATLGNGNAAKKFGNVTNNAGKVNGYSPMKITLNSAFLTNTYCDRPNSKVDRTKYSIIYTAAISPDSVTYNIIGKEQGTDKTLFTQSKACTDASGETTIEAPDHYGYKAVGVKVNGVDRNFEANTTSVKVTDVYGNDNADNRLKTVEFIYKANMTDVTIKAMYNGKPLTSVVKSCEIGKTTDLSASQPTVTGYAISDAGLAKLKNYTPTESGNNVIEVQYVATKGKVTLVAVNKDGNTEITRTESGEINKGDNITLDNYTKPTVTGYTPTSKAPVVKVGGQGVTAGSVYDGSGDVEIFYEFEQKTRNIKVNQYVVGTKRRVPGTTEETIPAKVGAYEPVSPKTTNDKYMAVGETTKIVHVEDKTGDLTVDFYYTPLEAAIAKVTVKLFEVDDEGNRLITEPFYKTERTGEYGVEMSVDAPTYADRELKDKNTTTKTTTPTENQPETLVVEFEYKAVYDTITVKKATEQGDNTDVIADEIAQADTYNVRRGESFEISAPSVDGYKVKTGKATTKSLTAKQIADNIASHKPNQIVFFYEQVETRPADQYHAKVVYHYNRHTTNVPDKTVEVGSIDSSTLTVSLADESVEAVKHSPNGWKLMGWSTKQDGAKEGVWYPVQGIAKVEADKELHLWAIWDKNTADTDRNVLLPGELGNAEDGQDVKISGVTADKVKKDKGYVEVPVNGVITLPKPDPDKTVTVQKGTVNVYPNGTIVIPENSAVVTQPEGNIDGPAIITPDGKVEGADKPIQKDDGSIVVPGQDGKTGTKDDVTIKPSENKQPSGTIDQDTGKVTTNKDTAKVNIPGTNPPTTNKDVTVPNGTTVDKDGTITLPENKEGTLDGNAVPGGSVIKPDGTVFYRYNIKLIKKESNPEEELTSDALNPKYRLVKTGDTQRVVAPTVSGYTVVGNGYFDIDAKVNDTYTVKFEYQPTSDVVDSETARVVFHSNYDDSVYDQTVRGTTMTLKANVFRVNGWTFGGWCTVQDGTKTDANKNIYHLYADKATDVPVTKGATLDLYAQWYKVSKDGNAITVPGSDHKPETDKDATANGSSTVKPTRDATDGSISLPAGGNVAAGDNKIIVPEGATGKLHPNGTVEITKDGETITITDPTNPATPAGHFAVTYQANNGTNAKNIEYVKNGSRTKVAKNTFTKKAHIFGNWRKNAEGGEIAPIESEITGETTLVAQWYAINDNKEITLPGKDGKMDEADDNVTVKPDPSDKDKNFESDKNGNITLPTDGKGGTVELPNEKVVVPAGTKVGPDGTITLPNATDKPIKPGERLPDGIILITYTSVDPDRTVKEYGTAENGVSVRSDVFTAEGKTLKGWTKGDEAVAFGDILKENATLKANWGIDGTTIPTVDDKVKLDAQTKEYILVLRGEWKNEKTHELKATIDGKAAPAGSINWRVKNDSYKNEFGFKGSMTGTDIVEVTDAVTGAIKVRNSGIVRVECVSNATQQVVCSVVVIVPGDVNRDGGVMSDDASLVMDAELDTALFPTFDLNNHKTWFWNIMADMNADTLVQSDDADFILDLDLGTLEI